MQVAVFVDVANLRERAQRLLDWFADSIGAAGGAGEANIGLYRRRAKAVGAGCDGPPQETGALTQIAERHVVRVVEQTVQAGGMVADVSEREVEIAFELDLGLQVPRVDHGRTPEALRYVVDALPVRLGRIEVGSGGQHGKAGVNLRAGKRIPGEQGLVGGETLERSLAKVGIDQRPVVDPCAAAKDNPVVEECGRPGKSDARFEILVVRIGPRFAGVTVAASSYSGKDQSTWEAARSWIGRGRAKDGCIAVRLVTRSVKTPAHSEIQGEVGLQLPVVLREECSGVSDPARRMNLVQCVGGTGLTNEECGKGVAVASLVGGVRRGLVGPEVVAPGCATASATDFADKRILVILHFTAEIEAVRAMLPVHDVVQRNCIVHILRVVVLAEARIGAAVEHKSGKDRTGAVGDSQLVIPVDPHFRGCRLVVVVGAVGSKRQ